MNKYSTKFLAAALIITCGATLTLTGCSSKTAQTITPTTPSGTVYAATTTAPSPIGTAAAESIALQKANRAEDDLTTLTVSYDNNSGAPVYNVAFNIGTPLYVYKIDAYTGSVLSSDFSSIGNITTQSGTATTMQTGTTTTTNYTKNSNGTIGMEQAKAIALAKSGAAATNVTFYKESQEYSSGKLVYKVYFYTASNKYEYEVEAYTGEIVKNEVKARTTTKSTNATKSASTTTIGVAKAKTIALEHAGVAEANASFYKAKQDYEKSTLVYELEFYAGATKYEYEINAYTGAIVKYEQKNYDCKKTAAGTTSTSTIGLEKAKSIALDHAGKSATAVTFTETETDKDNGRTIYEIEFSAGQTKYEYEIDAITGSIIKYETKTTGKH
jgi:uncharacterized membrane protein YkoI